MDKVLEFDYIDGDDRRHFIINADGFGLDFDGLHMDVGANDFELLEVEDGQAHNFEPTAVSWSGHRITQQDAIYDCVSGFLNNDPHYDFAYVDSDIESFKEENIQVVCSVNGRDIGDKYFHNEYAYDLLLVTDKAVYYSYDDAAVMLSADDGSLISDNYFAEEGFMTSVEDILRGEEREIYAPSFLDEVKSSVAQELDITYGDSSRESVNTGLIDTFDSGLEITGEYSQ